MCFIPFSITSCLAWRRSIALNQCCSRWRPVVSNFPLRSAMLLPIALQVASHSTHFRFALIWLDYEFPSVARIYIWFCKVFSCYKCVLPLRERRIERRVPLDKEHRVALISLYSFGLEIPCMKFTTNVVSLLNLQNLCDVGCSRKQMPLLLYLHFDIAAIR